MSNMPFQPGNTIGGRPKGSKNKVKSLREQLEARGFKLIDELLDRLPDMNIRQQGDILMELVQYVYPKLSAQQIDLQADVTPSRHAVERAVLNKLLSDPKSVEALRVLEQQLPVATQVIDTIEETTMSAPQAIPEIESHKIVAAECADKPDVLIDKSAKDE